MQDDIETTGDGAAKSLVTAVVLTAEGRRKRIYVTRLQVESAALVAATRFQDVYDAARTRLDEAMRLVELALTGTIEVTLRKGVLLELGLLDTLGRIEAEQHLWHLQQTAGWSSRALADARVFGYERVQLDTAPFMHAAHTLYEAAGFVDCAPYEGSEVPAFLHPKWRFMEKALHIQ